MDAGDLFFTCPFLNRLVPEEKARWESLGSVKQSNYDNMEKTTEAFHSDHRRYIVSTVTIDEIRVQQHKNVVNAEIKAGVEHITYTSFLDTSDQAYAHVYVTPDNTATEAYIRQKSEEIGIRYNFMQDNLYLENYLTTSAMLALMPNNKWDITVGEEKAAFEIGCQIKRRAKSGNSLALLVFEKKPDLSILHKNIPNFLAQCIIDN